MSQENVEGVRRIFKRWATGNFHWQVADVDPHVMLVVRPPLPAFGVFVGLGEIRDYWRTFLEQWEHTTLEATGLRAVGDTVLVEVIQQATGKKSGLKGDLRFFMLFTLRGGKIVRMDAVMDEADAHEAAGLSE